MYDQLIKWIGSQSCTLAGQVSDVLDVGVTCAGAQSWNMGVVVLALVGLSVAVTIINDRRRRYRESLYR